MNGGDISDTLKLGLVVLILCFLVGIVFQVFTQARSLASRSTNQLQSVTNQMIDMSYATYDNQTVFGSTVVSAVSQYSADKMTVVVDNSDTDNPTSVTATKANAQASPAVSSKIAYYGYALTNGLTASDDNAYYIGTLDADTSKKVTDTSTLKKMGDASVYVNEAVRYQAKLIRDETGEIVGVYFHILQG